MYYYSENEAYDELREDFIDEFQDQLQERDRGEELKLIAEQPDETSTSYPEKCAKCGRC